MKSSDVARRLVLIRYLGSLPVFGYAVTEETPLRTFETGNGKNSQWNTLLNLKESELSTRRVLLFSGNTPKSRKKATGQFIENDTWHSGRAKARPHLAQGPH